jgi:hypothetical protein
MSDGTALLKKKQAEVGTLIAAGSPDLKGDPTACRSPTKARAARPEHSLDYPLRPSNILGCGG